MFSNTRDKLSKSKLAVLAHRLVTEIEQVTGGHFPVQVSLVCVCVCVCVRCPDKSGVRWCLDRGWE